MGRLGGLGYVEAVYKSGVLLMPFAVLVWRLGGAFWWFSPMAAKKLLNGVPVITLEPPLLCSFSTSRKIIEKATKHLFIQITIYI